MAFLLSANLESKFEKSLEIQASVFSFQRVVMVWLHTSLDKSLDKSHNRRNQGETSPPDNLEPELGVFQYS